MSRPNAKIASEALEALLSALLNHPVSLKKVGERVREIYLERWKGTTERAQDEFAAELGCHQSQVSRYASGEAFTGQPNVLVKIAALDPRQRGLHWLLTGITEAERDAAVSIYRDKEISAGHYVQIAQALHTLAVSEKETQAILEGMADVQKRAQAHAEALHQQLQGLRGLFPIEDLEALRNFL